MIQVVHNKHYVRYGHIAVSLLKNFKCLGRQVHIGLAGSKHSVLVLVRHILHCRFVLGQVEPLHEQLNECLSDVVPCLVVGACWVSQSEQQPHLGIALLINGGTPSLLHQLNALPEHYVEEGEQLPESSHHEIDNFKMTHQGASDGSDRYLSTIGVV